MFFLFGEPMGVADTMLGKDVSYYLFSFPIYRLLQHRLLIAFLILLAGLCILYVVKNRLRTRHALHFGSGAKWHLNILVLIVFGIEIWDFMLQRDALLYDTSHAPLFWGPGDVEMNVILPLIWGALALLAVVAVLLIVAIQFRKAYKPLAACIALLALVLGVRYTTFLPQMIQTYIVKPNEIERERSFIAKSIQSNAGCV